MNDPDRYKPTRPMKGVWLLLTSKQRYVNAAIEHGVWVNLQAEDLRRNFLEGKYSPDSEEAEARKLELARFESLRCQLKDSLVQVSLAAILALIIAISFQTVDIDLPFHPTRLLGFIGTFLVAWATLFELGGPGLASWSGKALSEIVHPRIFQILFIPGTLALLCSILL